MNEKMLLNLRQPEIKERLTTIEHNEGTKHITNINVRGLGIGMEEKKGLSPLFGT